MRLRPADNTPDERVVGWWRVRWLLTTAVPVVVLAVLGALTAPARPWLLTPARVPAVLSPACTVFFTAWWFRVHRREGTGPLEPF